MVSHVPGCGQFRSETKNPYEVTLTGQSHLNKPEADVNALMLLS